MEIIPGILEKEWNEIERKINLVLPFARTIHIDLLDGKFAPNTTFLDPKPFAQYTKQAIFELHMMVENPEMYLDDFASAGFQRFLGHVEKMLSQETFVAKAENLGEVGLALDGATSMDAITVPFSDLDTVLVMTIHAGFSGQQLLPRYLEKVLKVQEKIQREDPSRAFPIAVDGGINETTIELAAEKGAKRFVTTSSLFKEGNPYEAYAKLLAKLSS